MKIKDLIKKLQEYDGEMKIYVYDWEDHYYDDYFEFHKEVESYMIGSDWKPLASRIDKNIDEAKFKTSKWKNRIHKDIVVIYPDY